MEEIEAFKPLLTSTGELQITTTTIFNGEFYRYWKPCITRIMQPIAIDVVANWNLWKYLVIMKIDQSDTGI